MTAAFILCNGETREDFDPVFLRGRGVVIGCNAVYKENDLHKYDLPDYVVAMEEYRREEMREFGWPKERSIFDPEEELNEELSYWREVTGRDIPAGTQTPRSNSGMLAMKAAIRMNLNPLYVFGFDCIIEGRESVSNLMPGKPETRASFEDTKRRVQYFNWFVRQNPTTVFKIVLPRRIKTIRDIRASNVVLVPYHNLAKEVCDVIG